MKIIQNRTPRHSLEAQIDQTPSKQPKIHAHLTNQTKSKISDEIARFYQLIIRTIRKDDFVKLANIGRPASERVRDEDLLGVVNPERRRAASAIHCQADQLTKEPVWRMPSVGPLIQPTMRDCAILHHNRIYYNISYFIIIY